MNSLTATCVTVRKNSSTVLENVDLCCAKGECTVVLGENGAGKSVMLRSLALSESGAFGKVEVLGKKYELSGTALEEGPWPDLTIVLQSLALWPHLNAGDNVLMPWKLRDPARRLTRDDLTSLFAALEITDLVARFPGELSGGQRQRVALARAVALRPKVLLLDEPSASLDARQAAALLTVLGSLKADGTAIVCVTHNLGFAAKIADSYAFLHGGRLVENGRWDALSASTSVVVQGYLELNSLR